MATSGQGEAKYLTRTERGAHIPTSVVDAFLGAFKERGYVREYASKKGWQGRRSWAIVLGNGLSVTWEVSTAWAFIQGVLLREEIEPT